MASYDSLFDPRSPDEQGGGLLGGYPWSAPGSAPWPAPWSGAWPDPPAPPAPTALQDAAAIPAGGGTALRDVAPQPLSEADLVQEALRAGAITIGRHDRQEKIIPPAAPPIGNHVDADRYYLAPVPRAPDWDQVVRGELPGSETFKAPQPTSWGQTINGMRCNTADGQMHCTTIGGSRISSPTTLPDGLTFAPGEPDYHDYIVADAPEKNADQATLRQDLDRYPTPGPRSMVRPATPEGTLNPAAPWYAMALHATNPLLYLLGSPTWPVRSYTTKDQFGTPFVMNITEGPHPLYQGVVARNASPPSDAGAKIYTEGTGSGYWQSPSSIIPQGWLDSANPIVWGGQAGRAANDR